MTDKETVYIIKEKLIENYLATKLSCKMGDVL
jgi:hypothetical protein